MKKILLGMSGGVDSTYAISVLREKGYTVEGAVLVMHSYTETDAARDAAASLQVPLHIVDAQGAFDDIVVRDFCDAYRKGETPNPCILCNEKVKFKLLYETAMRLGFDGIATGHYARISCVDGRYAVEKGIDDSKDQSYMLYRLPQEILAKTLFPLGEMRKSEVFDGAHTLKLNAAERKESQEICFVQGEMYTDYIERRAGKMSEGEFVDENGCVLGAHKGLLHYTIGQRKGLGIAAATRLFVKSMDVEKNRIILAKEAPRTDCFYVTNAVFSGITQEESTLLSDVFVKVRYLAKPVAATVTQSEEGVWRVQTVEQVAFVSPGQSAVFYRDGRVLFGGIIKKVE